MLTKTEIYERLCAIMLMLENIDTYQALEAMDEIDDLLKDMDFDEVMGEAENFPEVVKMSIVDCQDVIFKRDEEGHGKLILGFENLNLEIHMNPSIKEYLLLREYGNSILNCIEKAMELVEERTGNKNLPVKTT